MTKNRLPFDSPLPGWLARSVPAWCAGRLYENIIARRNRAFDSGKRIVTRPTDIPVISIGGIRVGGSGKTPATMFLIEYFISQGYEVAVLSRGYGRKNRSPCIVAPGSAVSWEDTGDEPAMMRRVFPDIWLGIGADRAANAHILASRMGAKSVMLMDDGFQHRKLHRDLDIVCVHDSLFDDRLLPMGYLREPVPALSRAQLHFCITDESGMDRMRDVLQRLKRSFPDSRQLLMISDFSCWVNAATGKECAVPPLDHPIALCGIARPHRFFDLLDRQGIEYVQKISFPDHYIFRESDFSALRKLYSQGFVTTEKDVIRLAAVKDLPLGKIWYCKIRLKEVEKEPFSDFNHYIKGCGLNKK